MKFSILLVAFLALLAIGLVDAQPRATKKSDTKGDPKGDSKGEHKGPKGDPVPPSG